jgi:hypothetical protein
MSPLMGIESGQPFSVGENRPPRHSLTGFRVIVGNGDNAQVLPEWLTSARVPLAG